MSTQKFFDIAGNQFVMAVSLVDSSGTSYTAGGSGATSPASSSQTSVSASTSDNTILASNSSRKGCTVYNDGTNILYLLLSNGTSSLTNFSMQVGPESLLSLRPGEYTGVIKGVWDGTNGAARVTEFY